MKKKYLSVIPVIIIIAILAIIQYNSIKKNYDELHSPVGMVTENYEKKLVDENNESVKEEEEYQRLLAKQDAGDIFSQGNEDSSNNQVEEENLAENQKDPFIPQLRLHALSALLLDAENNRVLYERNGYDELPMASTTKIMTCIVALENSKPEDIVEVSSRAAKMPDVQLNIKAGERYYMKDLLYSLMLESHNDTAVAIAEHIGGSVEGFAALMNDKARDLGCGHTNFVTPNGLDANGHLTTARDLAVIASYAIKNERFIEITNTSTHTFKEIQKGRQFTVTNKNRFLYMMEGAIGVKTGFTGGAGYCFVGAIKKTDRTLISVVLGCGWPPKKSLKWSDTKELMDFGIENYQQKKIFLDKDLPPIYVNKGRISYEELKCDGNIELLMREDEKVRTELKLPEHLQAPVKADSEVGKVNYYINQTLIKEIPIYAVKDIKRIDLNFCMKEIIQLWYGSRIKCD